MHERICAEAADGLGLTTCRIKYVVTDNSHSSDGTSIFRLLTPCYSGTNHNSKDEVTGNRYMDRQHANAELKPIVGEPLTIGAHIHIDRGRSAL